MRHAEPNLLHAYCWYAVRRRPDWSAWASLAWSCEVRGMKTIGDWNPSCTGDCRVTVYSVPTVATATPRIAASGSRKPMELASLLREFERLPRRLFGLGFGSVVIRGRLQLIVTQRAGRRSHSTNTGADRRTQPPASNSDSSRLRSPPTRDLPRLRAGAFVIKGNLHLAWYPNKRDSGVIGYETR